MFCRERPAASGPEGEQQPRAPPRPSAPPGWDPGRLTAGALPPTGFKVTLIAAASCVERTAAFHLHVTCMSRAGTDAREGSRNPILKTNEFRIKKLLPWQDIQSMLVHT